MKKNAMKTAAGLVCLAMAFAGVVLSNTGCCPGTSGTASPAKYIFLFIGDGMGATHVAATESYKAYKNGETGFERLSFTGFPVLGMAETYSANSSITCSSAAGTAISCGVKTNNGWLGISPEGDTLKSIASILKEKGYKVGIMSSVPVNHATPAAFYGHNVSRHAYYEITEEIPASGFDFLAGSGFIDYAGKDGDKEGSKPLLEKAGYSVCFGMDELEDAMEAGAEHIVLSQESYRGKDTPTYVVEKEPDGEISSEEMVGKCLEFFGDDTPFFIMFEQGDIDWAAHDNKTMPMIEKVMELDGAVKKAMEFYKEHPDETLILVTADHETGGITLGGALSGEDNLKWNILDSAWTASGCRNELGYNENKALNDKAYIGWTTLSHTGGPVPVYAIGKGSNRFGGRYDNTEIKGKILGE